MRVILVTPVFPHPRRGVYEGIERHSEGLSAGLKRLGHQVRVVTTFWNGGPEYENFKGIEIFRISDLSQKVGRVASALELNVLSFAFNLFRRPDLLEGDIVILNMPMPFLRFFRKNWESILIFHHREVVRRPIDILTIPFGLIYFRLTHADHLITHSRSSASELSRILGAPVNSVTVVPEGVDTGRFNTAVKPTLFGGRGHNDRILLYVGSLRPSKRVDILIRSMALLKEEVRNLRLIVVGKGPLEAALNELSRKSGVTNNVHFVGFVPDDELPSYYAACDVFVSASTLEGFGLTFLEAIACGKPIVGFRVSGVAEVVDGCGMLVDSVDESAFASAVRLVLSDPGLRARFAEAAKRRLHDCSWESTAARLVEVARFAARRGGA